MRDGFRRVFIAGMRTAMVLGLLVAWGGCTGCGKKREKKKPPKVVTIDWGKKWTRVNDLGETGRFHIKQGFGKLHGATTDEDRGKAYDEMIKGYKMIMEACEKGDELKAQVEAREPGKSFPVWEDKLSSWTEEASKVRKSSGMPLEYIDKMNE